MEKEEVDVKAIRPGKNDGAVKSIDSKGTEKIVETRAALPLKNGGTLTVKMDDIPNAGKDVWITVERGGKSSTISINGDMTVSDGVHTAKSPELAKALRDFIESGVFDHGKMTGDEGNAVLDIRKKIGDAFKNNGYLESPTISPDEANQIILAMKKATAESLGK